MQTISYLKQQHLNMFNEKRNSHRKAMCKLYGDYANSNEAADSKAIIFSKFYQYFSKNFPAEIYDCELIVGTIWHWNWGSSLGEITNGKDYPHNLGHFTADFEGFLHSGISGKKETIKKLQSGNRTTENNKTAFGITIDAFSQYIKLYAKAAQQLSEKSKNADDKQRLLNIAKDCNFIAINPPATFRQALQFVWFIQCFLETEASSTAISFGRMDKYLYPYYKKDIENGLITPEYALKLIMCFCIKASEGDESQMITLGGATENELSPMFIKAQTILNMRQPSIGVIVSANTSKELLEQARKLVLKGGGMPAYFNSDVAVNSLEAIGIDRKDAENFGIVGCYEAAPQGSYSNTVAFGYNLYDSFYEFVKQAREFKSFNEFLCEYKKYYEYYYKTSLILEIKDTLQGICGFASPFAGCALKGCVQRGLLPEQMGCDYFLFGLNIFGIGILIDSLYIIKKLVFEDKYTTVEYLAEQAGKNFSDEKLYAKICEVTTSYGSNSKESNNLAAEISSFIGRVVADNPVSKEVTVSPALFMFTFDIHNRNYTGTINGRKSGELLSYGIMPCATPHSNPTSSVLLSSANIACEQFPNGCPLMISLNKCDIEKDGFIDAVIHSFFSSGGSHIAINTVDASVLEQARKRPKEFSDIIVKISGYSTQFIGLDESTQNAVIERAKK